MKRLFTLALLALSSIAFGATLNPIQLLNPAGSTAGQAILSTGPSTAPAWASVTVGGLGAVAANTVLANVTASSASPTAFVMPSCAGSNNALLYSTSGTGFACQSGIARTGSPLSQFATTTSAQLAGVITDETGSGALVFGTSPTLATPTINTPTISGGTVNSTSVGATTPNTGSFTTLAASNNSAVFSTNTSAQSIPNGAFTTVTGWTAVTDRNSNWTASTGTFTAPRAGIYSISAGISMASAAWPAAQNLSIAVFKNGVEVAQATKIIDAAVTSTEACALPSVVLSLASSDTITIRVFQSQGAALALGALAVANWVSIVQIP